MIWGFVGGVGGESPCEFVAGGAAPLPQPTW